MSRPDKHGVGRYPPSGPIYDAVIRDLLAGVSQNNVCLDHYIQPQVLRRWMRAAGVERQYFAGIGWRCVRVAA